MQRAFWWIIIPFLLLTPVLLTPWVHGTDGSGYYVYLRSLALDGDLDFRNEYEHYLEEFPYIFYIEHPDTGLWLNTYMIGTPLLLTPFFGVGWLVAVLFGDSLTGYSGTFVSFTAFGSAFYVLLGLLLAYDLMAKVFSKRVALMSIGTVFFSSSLIYYTYFEPILSHGVSFFSVTLFFWYYYRKGAMKTFPLLTHGVKGSLVLGAIIALMTLIRPQNLLFASIILFDLVFYLKEKRTFTELISLALTGLLGFFGTFIPQFIVWHIQQGNFLAGPAWYEASGFSFATLWLFPRVLFSPLHGLFSWTPVAMLGILGLYYLYKRKGSLPTKKLSWYFLMVFLFQLFLINGWEYWYGAQSFGHRMFVNCTIIFLFGFAALYEKLDEWFGSWSLLLPLFLCAWNGGLLIQYGSRLICSECAVPLSEIAYNNFVEVPKRFWDIVKQFLFNRSSLLG